MAGWKAKSWEDGREFQVMNSVSKLYRYGIFEIYHSVRRKVMNFSLGDLLTFIGIVVAIYSIVVAIKNLNFSKRSLLVRDSYDPVINCLEENRLVKLSNSLLYNLSYLEGIERSYLIDAFEKNEQSLINEITIKGKLINKYKERADVNAKKAIESEILDRLPEWNMEEGVVLGEVRVEGDVNGIHLTLEHDNFIGAMIFGDIKVDCVLGHVIERVSFEEIGKEEEFLPKYLVSLEYYLDHTIEIPEIPEMMRSITSLEAFIPTVEDEIKEKFRQITSYYDIEKEHIILHKKMGELHYSITERIKQLLIPGYRWKKFKEKHYIDI